MCIGPIFLFLYYQHLKYDYKSKRLPFSEKYGRDTILVLKCSHEPVDAKSNLNVENEQDLMS